MNISFSQPLNVVRSCVLITSMLAMLLVSLKVSANEFELDMSDTELREHFNEMESIVQQRYTTQIRSHVYTYIKTNREKTQRLLDKSQLYFPVIEKYLAENDLPEDLKYLTIIESSLDPYARSWVGAVGLWQFMYYTGKECGLRITKSIDERRDVHRSTQAAVQYLTRLYEMYGDWALALSAYNAGPGRVNSAIRRSGSRDYWKLRPYLPRETRGYVPAFIAASYVFKHYETFGFEPTLPEKDQFFTGTLQVFQYMTFDEIEDVTGVDKQLIRKLNPAYRYSYIPYSRYGYTLTLPSRVVPVMENYLMEEGNIDEVELANDGDRTLKGSGLQEGEIRFMLSEYITSEAHSIFELAEIFRLEPYQIKYWNGLKGEIVPQGFRLQLPVFRKGEELLLAHYQRKPAVASISTVPLRQLQSVSSAEESGIESPVISRAPQDRLPWTVLQRGESYADLLRQRRKSDVRLENRLTALKKDSENFPLTYGCRIPFIENEPTGK